MIAIQIGIFSTDRKAQCHYLRVDFILNTD
jgi:hypothetical protein